MLLLSYLTASECFLLKGSQEANIVCPSGNTQETSLPNAVQTPWTHTLFLPVRRSLPSIFTDILTPPFAFNTCYPCPYLLGFGLQGLNKQSLLPVLGHSRFCRALLCLHQVCRALTYAVTSLKAAAPHHWQPVSPFSKPSPGLTQWIEAAEHHAALGYGPAMNLHNYIILFSVSWWLTFLICFSDTQLTFSWDPSMPHTPVTHTVQL